jgi:uridine kinase
MSERRERHVRSHLACESAVRANSEFLTPVPTSTLKIAEVVAGVLAEPPRCGDTRLVCVDGPSGSGKTVLAGRLVAAFGRALGGEPALVHMDDLFPGWDGLAAAVPLLHEQIVAQLLDGRAARYRRYDWDRHAYAEEHDLGRPAVLVVEGVSSGARPIARHAGLVIWVEAPRTERFRRGIARDGESYRPQWERWAEQEQAHFASDRTRERADLRIDGDPAIAHDPACELVLLP